VETVEVSLPIIQIRHQDAKLGIETQRGVQNIKQPEATLDIQQVAAKVDIHQGRGQLQIDQSDAWDAVGLGSSSKVTGRIVAQAHQLALEGIARRMREGRIARDSMHQPGNPFAAIAKSHRFDQNPIPVKGPASTLNVHINYEYEPDDIQFKLGGVVNNSQVNRPEVKYTPSVVNIYLKQQGKVEITPPEIDLSL
jgi:hypothetical protein